MSKGEDYLKSLLEGGRSHAEVMKFVVDFKKNSPGEGAVKMAQAAGGLIGFLGSMHKFPLLSDPARQDMRDLVSSLLEAIKEVIKAAEAMNNVPATNSKN